MNFNFNDFSRFRSELMGISIIVIMLFHCEVIPYGNIGVEFFLSISAIGLYYSLKKKFDVVSFYKRRIVRLVPAYVLFTIPCMFLLRYHNPEASIWAMLKLLLQIRTLSGHMWLSQWFISLILICYAITPLFFKYRKILLSNWMLFVISMLCFFFASDFNASFVVNRIPIFLVSLKMAQWVWVKKSVNYITFIIQCLLVFPVVYMVPLLRNCGIIVSESYLLYFVLTIPLLVLFTKCLYFLPDLLHVILKFLGGLTLELYLCHEYLCLPFSRYIVDLFNGSESIAIIFSIILAIGLAYSVHRLISFYLKKYAYS